MRDPNFPLLPRRVGGKFRPWRAQRIVCGLALGFALLAPLCADPLSLASISPSPRPSAQPRDREPIKPIPLGLTFDPLKVALGKALFHDPRLSRDNTISCSSCHDLARGGVDGRVRSLGIQKAEGVINAPTVFNCGLSFKQFWDGHARTLEEQIDGPLQSPSEMGSTWDEVVKKLRTAPEYAGPFARLYPGGIEPQNIKDAIALFERSLVTPNARFDQYLRGDDGAITADEKEGYRKFKSYGCASCHQGVNVGGNMFETLGAMTDFFAERGNITKADYGRFNVTGREDDRFVFKVPSLRNVACTAPYFHDGSISRLEDAVRAMGKFQLGQALADEDVDQLVKFLETLTGEYEGKPL